MSHHQQLVANRARRPRQGLTLIEVLVVIGIMVMLAAIAIPAALSAREQARRGVCATNLRQMTLACHAFASARGGFPGDGNGTAVRGVQNPSLLSAQALLLPHLDQAALFNTINGQVPLGPSMEAGGANFTATSMLLGTFVCPSDPWTHGRRLAPNSYRVNVGGYRIRTLRVVGLERRFEVTHDGAFAPYRLVRLGEFSDGTSNTLAISEKPVGSGPGRPYSAFRDWVQYIHADGVDSSDAWAAECARRSTESARDSRVSLEQGGSWLPPGGVMTAFTPILPPNSPVPDCSQVEHGFAGAHVARSYHSGGVNASMADGSVRWFSSSIDPRVWRDLGTRTSQRR